MLYPSIRVGNYQIAFVIGHGVYPFAFYTEKELGYSIRLTREEANTMVIIQLGYIIDHNGLPKDPMDWDDLDKLVVFMALP